MSINQIRKIIFIRHLPTKGNQQRRYIGTTDEPLCKDNFDRYQFNKQKKILENFQPDVIICSPMQRTRETASLFFPGEKRTECDLFREIGFGEYENKNYYDLKDEPAYNEYLDSGGITTFPGGEDLEDFKKRSVEGLKKVIAEYPTQEIAMFVHGGTIMACMEYLTKEPYFDFQVPCGYGYVAEIEKESMNCTAWYSLKGMEDEK